MKQGLKLIFLLLFINCSYSYAQQKDLICRLDDVPEGWAVIDIRFGSNKCCNLSTKCYVYEIINLSGFDIMTVCNITKIPSSWEYVSENNCLSDCCGASRINYTIRRKQGSTPKTNSSPTISTKPKIIGTVNPTAVGASVNLKRFSFYITENRSVYFYLYAIIPGNKTPFDESHNYDNNPTIRPPWFIENSMRFARQQFNGSINERFLSVPGLSDIGNKSLKTISLAIGSMYRIFVVDKNSPLWMSWDIKVTAGSDVFVNLNMTAPLPFEKINMPVGGEAKPPSSTTNKSRGGRNGEKTEQDLIAEQSKNTGVTSFTMVSEQEILEEDGYTKISFDKSRVQFIDKTEDFEVEIKEFEIIVPKNIEFKDGDISIQYSTRESDFVILKLKIGKNLVKGISIIAVCNNKINDCSTIYVKEK